MDILFMILVCGSHTYKWQLFHFVVEALAFIFVVVGAFVSGF